MGIQAMKSTANAGLLPGVHLKECLSYVLSLPIHCVALGCTTVGQIEDDVRVAQQFQPMAPEEMADLRKRASKMAGPRLENWKRNSEHASRAPILGRITSGIDSSRAPVPWGGQSWPQPPFRRPC